MPPQTERIQHIKQRMKTVPIVCRVLIANALVVVFGAVVGTWLARQFPDIPLVILVLVFALLGIGIISWLNYYTIRISLRALQDLERVIQQVDIGSLNLPESISLETDPDIQPLAQAVNEMLRRLQSHSLQLRALSERATNAQEEERRRIARNLHDDTSQAISSLIISLERLENALPEKPGELRQRAQNARLLATRTLEDLRKIIYDLRPTMLDDLGLVPAIRWYTRSALEDTGMRVSFDMPDESMRLDPNLETELFRITQEGVNNIARHSNARRVIVRLHQTEEHIHLELEDNGAGFDVEAVATTALSDKRLGLLGIQERVSLIGGEVKIRSVPNRGTVLQVKVPLPEAPDEL